jgi:hypothetical protein
VLVDGDARGAVVGAVRADAAQLGGEHAVRVDEEELWQRLGPHGRGHVWVGLHFGVDGALADAVDPLAVEALVVHLLLLRRRTRGRGA